MSENLDRSHAVDDWKAMIVYKSKNGNSLVSKDILLSIKSIESYISS